MQGVVVRPDDESGTLDVRSQGKGCPYHGVTLAFGGGIVSLLLSERHRPIADGGP